MTAESYSSNEAWASIAASTVGWRLMRLGFALFLLCSLYAASPAAWAFSCSSKNTGNWSLSSTWQNCNGRIPQDGDSVTINSGYTVTQDVNSSNLASLTINSGGQLQQSPVLSSVTLTVSGNLSNNGTITESPQLLGTVTVTVGGSVINNTNGTIDSTGAFWSTVNWSIAGGLTNGGTWKAGAGAISITGDLVNNSGGQIDLTSGNPSFSLGGNYTNNGTFSPGTGTFTLNGAGTQVMNSALSVPNLVVNNTSSGVTLAANLTVTGSLTLTDGVVATGSNSLIYSQVCTSSNPAGSGASFVNGNLTLTFPSGAGTCTFPVGSGSNLYAPVTVAFTNVTSSGGTLTATTQPDTGNTKETAAGLSPGASVVRYWTLTKGTLTFSGSYSATMQFNNPADLGSSANPSSFIIRHYTGGNWISPTVGALTSTSSQATGITQTGFGDFVVGSMGFDHVRVEHDGTGDTCGPKTLTVKACANASCSSLYSGSVTTSLSASAGSWSSNPVTFSGGSTAVSLTESTAGTVTVGASKPGNANNASDCYNTAAGTSSCTITFSTCSAACASSLSGVVNTYYPGVGSVNSGTSSVTVGSPVGSATGLKPNDLVLVIQMQDGAIAYTNDKNYGANNGTGTGAKSIGNAGLYEYKQVASYSGGVVTFTSPLVNSYSSAAAISTSGQKTFQVVRVPVLASYTLSTPPTALAWSGSAGGVLAFDVTGALTFSGNPTLSVDGMGFAGGVGRSQGSGSGSNTDYVTYAGSNLANGSKGEGISGSPNTADKSTGPYGYPAGSNARGAPGNAGGGATDGNPPANDQNPGGGGGAGWGSGGMGGIGWCSGFNANTSPSYNCSPSGGLGGTGITAQGASRLTLGGGGGAGTANNGYDPSGAAGGGLIFVRAGSLSGAATFSAKGLDVNTTVCNDGVGGGGGGGAVLIQVGSGNGLNNVTINVNGGKGGTNLNPANGCGNTTSPHGPGGGGGGGFAITSVANGGSSAPLACNRSGGSHGDTYNNGVKFVGKYDSDPSGGYGSVAGSAGSCSNTTGTIAIGAALGTGPCAPTADHYAIALGSATAVTCQPETVTVIPHDSNHNPVAMDTSTTIRVNATIGPGNGGVAAKGDFSLNSGGGIFTPGTADAGGNGATQTTYTFASGETSVRFNYQNTWGQTVNFNVSTVAGGAATERSGSASADNPFDPDQTWSLAGFRFVDASNAAVGSQVAGVSSGTYYLQPAIASCTTYGAACAGVCADTTKSGPFAAGNTVNVAMAYTCTDPATCSCTSAPSTCAGNGQPTLTVTNNSNNWYVQGNSGTVSSYINVPLKFAAAPAAICSGTTPCTAAPFTLNFTDAGKITLSASYTVSPGGGGAGTMPPSTPMPMTGTSAAFVVRPYAFTLIPCTGSSTPCSSFSPITQTDGTGSVFAQAGLPFNLTIKAVASSGAATPNFGQGSNAATETVSLSSSLVAPSGGAAGVLSGTGTGASGAPSLYRSAFNNGVATVTDLKWSEVGIITLTAANSTFLGNSLTTTGTSGNVGRFYPHHFGVIGTVAPHSDVSGAGTFTYMGEPMQASLTVTAYNASETPTKNYASGFAKLDAATLNGNGNWFAAGCAASTQCMGLGAVSGNIPLSSRLAIDTTSNNSAVPANAGGWANGASTFTLFLTLKRGSLPDGPYNALTIGAKPLDSDGVTLPPMGSSDANHCVNLDVTTGGTNDVCTFTGATEANLRRRIFQTAVRYGRLWLANAFGSEFLPLKVPVQAQYWTGNGWGKSTDDIRIPLTVPTSGNGGLKFYAPPNTARNALAAGEAIARMGAQNPAAGATGGTAVLVSGDAWLWLTSPTNPAQGPGTDNSGFVDIIASTLGAPAWLPPISDVRACFGTCGPRSTVIYLRERY